MSQNDDTALPTATTPARLPLSAVFLLATVVGLAGLGAAAVLSLMM
ncbi:MAG: hypothetical protein AAGP08_12970 [Pseudomonadota bacterium]